MNKTRRVTANLPDDLLRAAQEVTGRGITETLVEGLEQIRKRRFFEKAMALKGKINLDIDIDKSRGRRRR
ncbi:MAG TPA: hypothetical protein VGS96_03960 [Thermoanaerobaculia bacterium]|jgi:hypothetical protein|nr:hypothetical protein [Thermoanaerobaculia bacterium]